MLIKTTSDESSLVCLWPKILLGSSNRPTAQSIWHQPIWGTLDSVTVSEEALHISGDKGEAVVEAMGQNAPKTPTKKKKGGKKRKHHAQMPAGVELPSPGKVAKGNSLDEDIEVHYIGMLRRFYGLFSRS